MTIIEEVEQTYVTPLFVIFSDATKTPMERTMAYHKSGKIQALYKNPKDTDMKNKAKTIFDDATVFNVDANGQIQAFDEEEQIVYNSFVKNPNTPIDEEIFEVGQTAGKRRKKSNRRNRKSRNRKSRSRKSRSRKSHRK